MKTVTIPNAMKLHETAKAVLYKADSYKLANEPVPIKFWIPKSVICDVVDKGEHFYGVEVIIPMWFADKLTWEEC